MKNLRIYLWLPAIIFALSSCTDHDGDPVAEMDRQFMISAADGNLFEIRAGEIASQKATNDSVKAYGRHMVMDHSMATQELMALASKKGVSLPTALSPAKQMKIDSLNPKTGMDFDVAYMKMMVTSHVETISLFEMEASNGLDAEVKSWAAGKLPTLKHHLEKAKVEMERQFMISAANANLFEIRAGEIAAQKAAHDSVKAYGHHMVMDHSMATKELMALASKKNVSLPTALSPAKQMKIDSLNAKTGMDFDVTYMNMMVASHVETTNLFEMEASKGMDAEVITWAAGKLPTLNHHLEKARAVKKSL